MESNYTTNDTNVSCVLPHSITENQWMFYNEILWWLEGFGSVLVGSIGIVLNLITICVLLGSELAASFFNWLLVCLAMFDSLLLVNGILEACRSHIGSTNFHTYMFVVFLYSFRSGIMCGSIYTTVLLALERYNAIVRPTSHQGHSFQSGKQSLNQYFKLHWMRLLKYIGPIIILSTLFYIPKRFELEFVKIVIFYI